MPAWPAQAELGSKHAPRSPTSRGAAPCLHCGDVRDEKRHVGQTASPLQMTAASTLHGAQHALEHHHFERLRTPLRWAPLRSPSASHARRLPVATVGIASTRTSLSGPSSARTALFFLSSDASRCRHHDSAPGRGSPSIYANAFAVRPLCFHRVTRSRHTAAVASCARRILASMPRRSTMATTGARERGRPNGYPRPRGGVVRAATGRCPSASRSSRPPVASSASRTLRAPSLPPSSSMAFQRRNEPGSVRPRASSSLAEPRRRARLLSLRR